MIGLAVALKNQPLVQLLLDAGWGPPLTIAVLYQHEGIVQALLTARADPGGTRQLALSLIAHGASRSIHGRSRLVLCGWQHCKAISDNSGLIDKCTCPHGLVGGKPVLAPTSAHKHGLLRASHEVAHQSYRRLPTAHWPPSTTYWTWVDALTKADGRAVSSQITTWLAAIWRYFGCQLLPAAADGLNDLRMLGKQGISSRQLPFLGVLQADT